MKKNMWILIVVVLLILALAAILYVVLREDVNDIQGQWDVNMISDIETDNQTTEVTLFVQDVELLPEQENTFIANGCMETISSGKQAPLSLMATYFPEKNKYEIQIYSTVVPVDAVPFVIRFDGALDINGSAIKDDKGQGTFISENNRGSWDGIHQNRKRASCAGIEDAEILFEGDVYAHKNLAESPPIYFKYYETITRVVSAGMVVETPDGEVIEVQPYTDLFSPDVDFISEFRYLSNFEGQPISGEVYKFTLLDIHGNPLPGISAEDVWMGCQQEAPQNLNVNISPNGDINLSWDPVPDAEGWEPGREPQIGYYQIGLSPMFDSPNTYGANGIASTSHVIPWASFEPGDPGSPDGFNFGVSIGELSDGEYEITVGAFAIPPSWSKGTRIECNVFDSSQFIHVTKTGNELNLNE